MVTLKHPGLFEVTVKITKYFKAVSYFSRKDATHAPTFCIYSL